MKKEQLERGYFTPNDVECIAETDSKSIQRAVNAALASGLGRVVIPRYNKRTDSFLWETDEAIILDSDLEIVLDNCYIRQADNCMDNIFRNFQEEQMRSTLEDEQHNIVIRGIGNAILEGGNPNGLTEATSKKNGLPHVERNNVIRLHNLRNFRMENFTILNQRWWAINLHYVEEGRISGLNIICANNAHNQDGVDLRSGCNNILIENMFGQSGDDFIALTGFYGSRESEKYAVAGKSIDIHDIVIKNIVATSAECAVVALRCQDGVKIYNITIDTVHDVMSTKTAVQKDSSFVFKFDNNRYTAAKSPYTVIRIGQDGWVHKQACAPGDVHSIHVNNIHARCNCAVMLNMDIENSYFGNIYAENGVDRIISTASCRKTQAYGVNMRNTVFENIFYQCTDNEFATAFDFELNTKECTLENVFIRHAFVGNCKNVINMQHKGVLTVSDLHGESVRDRIHVREGSVIDWAE